MKKLHPIDAFGISKVSLSSIRVERLEERIHPKVAFPHKHDFYQLILFTNGSGQHFIDFKQHKVAKYQLYMMKPGQIHTWVLAPGTQGLVIEFNQNSLESLIEDIDYTEDVLQLKKNQDFAILENTAELMLEEFRASKELMDISLKGLLSSFLAQVIRLTGLKARPIHQTENLVDKFKELVEKKFKQEHRVEYYAQELGVTPKALTMQLSRTLGKSPRLLIQDRFLLEAKRYLAYSDMSIAEIGFEIGFEDANYFTRFFKLHESMTPAQFRIKSSTQPK
jgi:AraC family transcriptional activator of pobA